MPVQTTDQPLRTIGPPMLLADKAWLTYQALDQSDDIILMLESDSSALAVDATLIGANGAFCRATGYSEAQLIGQKSKELFPLEGQSEILLKAIREGGTLRSEIACSRAKGGSFTLGLHLMPVTATATGNACFVVIGRDITAVLAARQMQDSIQRLLAKVFTSVDEALAIVNSGGRIVMTNPGMDRLLGYQPNELVGRISLEVVAPEAREAIAARIKQQMEQKHDVRYSAPFLRADGTKMLVDVTAVVVSIDDVKQFRIITLRASSAGRGNTHGSTTVRSETTGRIYLVGLDEVRAVLGDRWKAMAERAMATGEAVLKRQCGAKDSFSRADDTSFLVCFGDVSEQVGAFRAAMIAREIRERLIGQGVDPDTAFVRSITAAVPLPGNNGKSATASKRLLLDGLDKQQGRVEQDARQALQNGLVSSDCELDPVLGRNSKDTIAYQIRIRSQRERCLVSALSSLPRTESEAFDLDALLLEQAAQQAITAIDRGVSMPLLVNVRFDVFLTRAATERYSAACRKIDPRATPHLILMLSSLPQGLPKTRLLEWVTRLRPFCCAVGYQVDDLATLTLIDLSNSFNPIVGLTCAALPARAPDKIRMTIASLHARNAKVLIHQVPSEPDATVLRSLGADMILMERLSA